MSFNQKIKGLVLAGLLLPLHLLLLPSACAETLDTIVAIVDDDVVMSSELQRQIERVRGEATHRGAQLPPDSILSKQVLERLILMKIQLQLAEQSGIKVDDNILNRAISNIASENNMSLETFRETLENENIDFNQFREDIRKEIILSRLRQSQIDNRVFVSDREVDNYLATQSQQGKAADEFHIKHILIAIPDGADEQQIESLQEKAETVLAKLKAGDDFATVASQVSDAGNVTDGGDLGWMSANDVPSLFRSTVAQMKQGEFSDLIRDNSGFHIIKLQNKRTSDVHIIHQTRARHILIRPNELISDDEAQTRLQQLKVRIEGGDQFAELAKSHSDDNGTAVDGGELGWVSPGDTVPEFEKVMNSLNEGQISDPFKSQFGWHIIQVLEHRDHDGTEEVTRATARAAVKKRKTEDEYQSWLIRLRDEAYVEYR